MNNSIENKDDILHKPHLSESILKIKEKISKKNETNNVREEKFKKHIDAFANKKDVSYTNKAIFGTNFSPNKENIYCSLGYLIVNLLINNDGSIVKKTTKTISKTHLWSYIYYLRLNNKTHPYFLQNLGQGNKISALKFYSMIASNKKSVTKKNLINFIQLILNSGYKVNIPFLQADKHVVSLVNAYHNNIVKNSNTKNSNTKNSNTENSNTKNSNVKNNNIIKENTDENTVNIKIVPSIKLISNSNIKYNANSKNANIKITLDIEKNSNNTEISENQVNSPAVNNTEKNVYKKSQTNNIINVPKY